MHEIQITNNLVQSDIIWVLALGVKSNMISRPLVVKKNDDVNHSINDEVC